MFGQPDIRHVRYLSHIYREDDKKLEEAVADTFNTFLTNNLETGNLGSLIRVFLLKASDLKASAQLDRWASVDVLVTSCAH